MKATSLCLGVLFVMSLLTGVLPVASKPFISCGDVITESTVLNEDLLCPASEYAIVMGAPNITLDLGGHLLQGDSTNIGVFSNGFGGLTIQNGVIENFSRGIFLASTPNVIAQDLTVRNLEVTDPNNFIFGVAINDSQDVTVRNMLFEFPIVPHKEAVEVFGSQVAVSNIEVRGGGAGVSFSFNGTCDSVNSPSNGTVRNSKFIDVYIAAIWVSCSSSARIEDNQFYPNPGTGIGIQGDAPFDGAVRGLVFQRNFVQGTAIGVELRGIREATIANNTIRDNDIWGIAVRQSLGCLTPEPYWECFTSTANTISGNRVLGNGMDLYHFEEVTGNTWERNICETKDGSEIPECLPAVNLVVYIPLARK